KEGMSHEQLSAHPEWQQFVSAPEHSPHAEQLNRWMKEKAQERASLAMALHRAGKGPRPPALTASPASAPSVPEAPPAPPPPAPGPRPQEEGARQLRQAGEKSAVQGAPPPPLPGPVPPAPDLTPGHAFRERPPEQERALAELKAAEQARERAKHE